MGWADDMYDAGYTSNHGGLMDEHDHGDDETRLTKNKREGKATKRLPFCTAAELNKFVGALTVDWEANELTLEEVHELASSLMVDAAYGKLLVNGKAVYAKTLGAKLKEAGCFLIEKPKKPTKATKRLTFCTAAELNKFVGALTDGWEDNELTHEEADALANSLMDDAASGKLLVNGKAVYAKTLSAKLKEAGCFLIEKPRKSTKHLPLCSKQELNEFLDALIVGWETNERTQKEVHERCLILMDDAASGKLLVNGKAVYAKTLGAKLRGRGYFLEEAPKGKMEIDPSYL